MAKNADEMFDETPTADAVFQTTPEGGAMGGGGGDTTPSKPLQQPKKKFGGLMDFINNWGNEAALGAGPQIEGGMAAVLEQAKSGLDIDISPAQREQKVRDAYEYVRDEGKKKHAAAADTVAGGMGGALGALSTPGPVPIKGASISRRALQSGLMGAGAGGVSGATQSDVDLLDEKPDYGRLLLDTATGMGTGFAGGALAGGGLAALEKPARSMSRKLPMDMLGVSEPARRSMQRQGTHDAAGDELLKFVKPFRSGMRKGSLTEDLVDEAGRRGKKIGSTIDAIDELAPDGVVMSDEMAAAIGDRADPMRKGSVQDKQVVRRMEKEAESLMGNHGDLLPEVGAPMSLADAEKYKQRFGPAVAKQLRHAGEPAAKTDALSEVYRAVKEANEAGAAKVSPELAEQFKGAKRDYSLVAGPLEGANVERGGLMSSDFDWGDALTAPPPNVPGGVAKAIEAIPIAGPLVVGGANLAGRAYGRGLAANAAEFLANRAAKNTGGIVGARAASPAADPLADYLEELKNRPPEWAEFLKGKP